MADWTDLLGAESDGALTSVTALVGAGVSVDAGLPVAYTLFDEVVRRLVRRRWAAEQLMRFARVPRRDMRDEHDFIRFETLLLWVSRVFDPRLALFEFLDAFTVPGDLHRRLTRAATRGLTLVTVNFDDLLERALIEQGATPLTVDAQRPVSYGASDVPVYKLHGTRLRHAASTTTIDDGALLATTELIAAAHPGTFLNEAAAQTLSSLVDGRILLVAGYSASDDLDIVPTLAASRPARVVWIDHRDSQPRRTRTPSARARLPWRRLLAAMGRAGVELVPISGRTADAFEAMGLHHPTRGGRRSRAQWRPAVRSWARSVSPHDPTGLGLAALLFGELGRYELVQRALTESRPSPLPDGRWTAARRIYEQGQTALLREPSDPRLAYELALTAQQQATRPNDARTAVLAELLLGRAAFLQQRYLLAASHFRTGQHATQASSAEHAYARAWLGRAQVWDGRPKLGLRQLHASVASFRQRGDLEGLLDALEAIGVGCLALMQLSEADDALAEAYALARALGFVDRRFTTSCSLAELQLLAGRPSQAERRIRSTLRNVPTGGNDEVADAWAVLAESSLEARRLRAAASAARRAMATTTSINRSKTQEHLCSLVEAQMLSGASDAARRTLLTASSCAADETTLLGRARLTALETARHGSHSPRIPTGLLLPAAVVRLADTVRRLELVGPPAVRLLRRAEDLRQACGPTLAR